MFDYARSICFYNDVSASLIKSFKYGNVSQSGIMMASMMAQYIASDPILSSCTAITYIPFGYFKRYNRFYNHSEKLCSIIADLTGMKMTGALLKQNNIVPQAILPEFYRKRRRSLFKSIVSNKSYESLLIIDDVMTTGRTLSDAAKSIKDNNNAESVCCLTFANG